MIYPNSKSNQRGFTIVELLIVIVVISILTAITVVAYNGVQNRARTVAAQSAANNVQKKAEAYNAEEGSYPSTLAALTGASSSASYSLTGITFSAADPSSPSNPATVSFYTCTGGGNKIGYYNYTTQAAGYIYTGPATSGSTCALTAS
jgi:prepilin-type N-terminal cleavage/methylation domain-containing protein